MVDGLEDDGVCCGMTHDMQTQPSLQEQLKRVHERLAAALEWKEAELQRALPDEIQAVLQMKGREGIKS